MFCFGMLKNNLYVIFIAKNLEKKNLCITFASVNKKQIKYLKIMRTMYLIEHYAINRKNGAWSLIGYSRVDYREKKLVMKSLKKQGYKYNRSEKAYIQETDPAEFSFDKAVTVKSYAI